MFSKKRKEETTPAEATPTLTPTQWQERIADLEAQAEQARQALEQKRAQRSDAAGRVIVFGQPNDSVNELVEQEKELERAAENLDSAIGFAKAELGKAQAEEERVRLAERLALQRQIGLRILECAARVDQAFAAAAADLRSIESLNREYLNAGGGYSMRLKICASRATRGCGLRNFITETFVGDNVISVPLTKQFASMAGRPDPEALAVDEAAAKRA